MQEQPPVQPSVRRIQPGGKLCQIQIQAPQLVVVVVVVVEVVPVQQV